MLEKTDEGSMSVLALLDLSVAFDHNVVWKTQCNMVLMVQFSFSSALIYMVVSSMLWLTLSRLDANWTEGFSELGSRSSVLHTMRSTSDIICIRD